MKIQNPFRKFDENISLKQLFIKFLFFVVLGICVLLLVEFIISLIFGIQPPDPAKSDEVFCSAFNLIFLSLAFLLETIIFMILPWKIWKLKGLTIGLIIWAFLHLLGSTTIIGGIPFFCYISIKAVFYYRLLEIGKWKEAIGFHFLVNLPAILTCL